MDNKKFEVTGMTCAACSAHVEKAVAAVDGVSSVSVSLLTNSMNVDFSSPATPGAICSAVKSAGYGAAVQGGGKTENSLENELNDTETPRLLKILIASLCLLLPLMYVSMGHLMWGWGVPRALTENPLAIGLYELILASAVMVINQRFFISGFKSLMHRAPNMDTLVALGSGASFIYSTVILFMMTVSDNQHHLLHEMYFESAAMIVTLITVGKLLEAKSKGRTTDAIKGLMKLAPDTAHVVRNDMEIEISSDEVIADDIFIVRPGESIPVDGIIIEGESAVNESALTGESLPADKAPGDSITAATINQNGVLRARATRVGADTTLSRIIEMVENAAATKAPIAKIADRVSGIFVPSVIAVALITGIVWLIAGSEFGFALARAVSVLVISCPCALGLATPVAIMVGSGVGAKNGVLFKTAASLEMAGRTGIVVLDKTGTVTEGKPVVTDVIPLGEASPDALTTVAAALELNSEHPLARAVVRYADEHGIAASAAKNFNALPGHGVRGTVDGRPFIGGNAALMKERGILTREYEQIGARLSEEGKTPLFFADCEKAVGIIAVADKIKADSADAVGQLKNMGIQVVMLTGDNRRTALAVANQVGIFSVVSDVLPDEKEEVVRRLSEYGKTAMVGDGINDTPALTRADTGIAIGAGSDIALDAADVVLMKSDLTAVPSAVRLSRRVIRNIHENLFWAFIYNCIGIPLAAGVLIPAFGLGLNPMFGAAAMSLSSFCVVMNALRLNFIKPSSPDRYRKKEIQLPDFLSDSGIYNNSKNGVENEMKKTVYIEGMMCEHCTAHVKKALEEVNGIKAAEMNLSDGTATVTIDSDVEDSALTAAVTGAGYTVKKIVK